MSSSAGRPAFRSLHANGMWLAANTVITGLLGLAFWAVAARLYPVSAIGREGALVNGMIGLSAIGQLGLSAVIARFLPLAGSGAGRLIARCYGLACGATLLLAAGLLLVLRLTGIDLFGFGHSLGLQVLFVLGAGAWAVFVLQDAVLAAVRAAKWVTIENAVFGVVKMALLPVAAGLSIGHGIFVAWVAPMLALLLPVNLYVLARLRGGRAAAAESAVMRSLGRRGIRQFVGMEFAAAVVVQLSSTLLPVLVVAVVGPVAGAAFYLPFLIVLTADLLILALTTSLTVEAAHAERSATAMTRSVAMRCAALVAAIVAGGLALAPMLTLIFGDRVTEEAVLVLRLLVLATPARAVLTLYATVARVRGHGGAIVVSQALVVPLLLVGVYWLGHLDGIRGVALAWIVAHVVIAGAVLPRLIRALRSGAAPTGEVASTVDADGVGPRVVA